MITKLISKDLIIYKIIIFFLKQNSEERTKKRNPNSKKVAEHDDTFEFFHGL